MLMFTILQIGYIITNFEAWAVLETLTNLPKVWDKIKTHWTLYCMNLQLYNYHKQMHLSNFGKMIKKIQISFIILPI